MQNCLKFLGWHLWCPANGVFSPIMSGSSQQFSLEVWNWQKAWWVIIQLMEYINFINLKYFTALHWICIAIMCVCFFLEESSRENRQFDEGKSTKAGSASLWGNTWGWWFCSGSWGAFASLLFYLSTEPETKWRATHRHKFPENKKHIQW